MKTLALLGGKPVRTTDTWPKWPIVHESTAQLLNDVLRSGRWTIRGWHTGQPSAQTELAKRFTALYGTKYFIPTASGSASLVLALEALNIGVGDEVLVPVYTWYATAVAVTNVNAVPVFIDAHPMTGCMDPAQLESAITSRTRAILPVHLHCSVADMDSISAVAEKHALDVVEDCAQAHGAEYKNEFVGTIGRLGAFSMNQEKLLCCGEGGAIVTSDEELYDRAFRLRTDGSRLKSKLAELWDYEIEDVAGLMGTNMCMSDFQAAVLIPQLDHLFQQNQLRQTNADYLTERLLAEVDGLIPIESSTGTTRRAFFKYAIRREPDAFSGVPTRVLGDALTAELGLRVEQTECAPLHTSFLFAPETKMRHRIDHTYLERLDKIRKQHYPVAEQHYETTLVFHHRALLGSKEDMNGIIEAYVKVAQNAAQLRDL